MGKNKCVKNVIAISISLLMVLSNFTMQSYVVSAATKIDTGSKNSSDSELQNNLINNLKKYNKSKVKVDVSNQNNGQLFISGILSDKKSPSEKEALKFLEQNKVILGLGNVTNNFKNAKITIDSAGYTHVKLHQYLSGSPVEGKQLTVHFNKEGIITSVSGNAVPGSSSSVSSLEKSSNKKITESEAISIAKSQFKMTDSSTSKVESGLSSSTKNIEKLLKAPASILSLEPTVKKIALVINKKVYEVYSVNIKYTTPTIGNWNVYVETSSGKVIDKQSNIRYSDAPAEGTGIGVDGKVKKLNLDLVDGVNYFMTDLTKPMSNSNNITTLTADNGYGGVLYRYYSSSRAFTSEYGKAIVDAHYNAGIVYDFYKNLFNRNSIDGNGMPIYSVAHLSYYYNNAFWDGSAMWYGDGDGSRFTYLSGDLDVVGHEMTHGVTEANGDLYYHNQSGALNESMSDVFGVLIETYNKYNVKNNGTWKFNAADWVIGDDIYTPYTSGDALRSLANPTLYEQPDNMSNYNNLPDDDYNDNGGVHTNSGITNKAAYLIAKSIGMAKTAKIYYNAYNYLSYDIDFQGAANAIIQATTDLYGASSAEVTSVKSAFMTVKVIAVPKMSVKFNSQGGTAVTSKTTAYNSTITAPSSPTKTGYTFGGWYKEAGCSNAWNFATNKVIANTTLYAKWKAITLGIPTGLKAASSSYNSINISWNGVNGASRYEVYKSTSSKGKYNLISTITARNYNNTGLTTNSTYYYKVRAYRMVGTVKVYSYLSSIVSSKPVPAATTNVKATRTSSKSIKVTWKSTPGASGYEVFRATSSGGKYSMLSRMTSSYYTNSSLVRGRTYYYKVRSYRNVGKARVYGNYWSNIVHAKP
ncbi:M4 family metallopeptidase [Clostridium algoriphilum]|uniref:M4 family metallopeptidase n=1 Tax=Clostridium algoriphilum TaxID=198347 RepID=UPI001CF47DB2|nr:M4 family metallopeptidase [Clostridium algoriphilum]MCB2293547.1 M4 family metallopeptidase [Clostridium algoriphilum]